MDFLHSCWCTCLFLIGSTVLSANAFPALPAENDRVVIQSVRLLRPSGVGLKASDPIDVLVENGQVAQVDQELIGLLKPGQMALRGRNLWLIPAPCVRLPGESLVASDLIVGGVLGVGRVDVISNGGSHQHLLSRARLDGIGLPLLEEVSSGSEPDDELELTASSISELRLPSQPAAVARLLGVLDKREADPFLPGAPARFLVLQSDPREDPSALADPFAVVQGSEVILKSERAVLLDEYAAFQALEPPTAEALAWPSAPSESRLYRLIIRGLPRGYVLVASWNASDGSVVVRVAERIAAPLKEVFEATVHWPSGAVSCDWVVQSRSFKMRMEPAPDASGGVLHIALNGVPIQEEPITLKPGDQFLPHSMLIAFDALCDPSNGATRRVVEVDVMGAPARIDWTPRVPLKPASEPLSVSPLTEAQIRALGGGVEGRLLARLTRSDETASRLNELPEGELLLFDGQTWPRLMILSTPWGVVEWISEAPER